MNQYFCVVLWIFFAGFPVVMGDILASIQWSPQNEIFIPNKTCNKISVLPMDTIHFICPHSGTYLRQTVDPISSELRHQNIFMLTDEEQFRTCNGTGGRLILKCDDPTSIKYTGVKFSRYSASDKAPRFISGSSYYFINTAQGMLDTLDNMIGGSCSTDNMKLEVYVCHNSSDPRCANNRGPLDCHEFAKEHTEERESCKNEETTNSPDEPTTTDSNQLEEGDAKARACTESSQLSFKLVEFVGYLTASFFIGFACALLFCWACCKSQPRKRGKCYKRMCGFCCVGKDKCDNANCPGSEKRYTAVWYTSSV